ncbi:MAG TPA: hypothetical protein VK891_02430, partial [Euzebyales bacterium]|nr:hypothetical protein [Euzebyales bacterium]
FIPDSDRRQRLLDGVREPPDSFWRETIPQAAQWPEAPVGVLLFSRSYEGTARAARERQWPLRRLSANNHFLCLSDEYAVAEELVVLADDLTRSSAA